jgi:HAD superfamily hydrolase (TIGR01549 family)
VTDTVIFDVDGTLVDTNYHHAVAWFRAFRRYDITLPVWHLHRAIGMGGDQLITHVAGEDAEHEHGDDLRAAHGEEFDALIGEVCAFPEAQDLLRDVKQRGFTLVLATSGSTKHSDHFLSLIDGDRYADARTTSGDVEASKPAPDLIQLALERGGGRSAVMVGDSVWDGYAAQRAGTPFLAIRTGGFSREELAEAGAHTVYGSLGELGAALDDSLISRPDDR